MKERGEERVPQPGGEEGLGESSRAAWETGSELTPASPPSHGVGGACFLMVATRW